jgi:hypothetical protein
LPVPSDFEEWLNITYRINNILNDKNMIEIINKYKRKIIEKRDGQEIMNSSGLQKKEKQ